MKFKSLFLLWILLIPLFACNEKSEVKITETKADLVLDMVITNENLLLKSTKSVVITNLAERVFSVYPTRKV